jgi:ABC-2 type transport system permease protein
MNKLLAAIKKDVLILMRDKVGLLLMFVMPIVLAVLITSIQNNTFKLVNDNKVVLLILNADSGESAQQLIGAIKGSNMFEISESKPLNGQDEIQELMQEKDALVAIAIPKDFSGKVEKRAKDLGRRIFADLGLSSDTLQAPTPTSDPVVLYYHPVLQESYRASVNGALKAALQLVENKMLIKNMYAFIDEKKSPANLENDMRENSLTVEEIPVMRNGSRNIPNATQHNIPAWTIFAMFFVVVSLGSSIVKEKLNGSFIRLKTLPTNYLVSLLSKQITYLFVTLAQAAIIFSIGSLLFPFMGLPQLNIPDDLGGLLFVTFICGLCAVSFAICIGVFAQTQEQANGFGAVSIVILAAIGGILVPAFAMPDSFQGLMKLSPLHWCLESYYGLFLEGGKLKDIVMNIIPLVSITFLIWMISLWGLKRKNLI